MLEALFRKLSDGKQNLSAELTSLAALTSTSYGRSLLETANLAALQTSVGSVQVGTIIIVPGSVVPAGYLECDGASLSRATYADLWSFANVAGRNVAEATWSATSWGLFSTGDLSTTFRVPNLQGEFIRFWDNGRGVDSGRGIGVWQDHALQDHYHYITNRSSAAGTNTGNGYLNGGISTNTGGGIASGNTAAETRPRNVAMMACIKY